jgi:hypothetical protein
LPGSDLRNRNLVRGQGLANRMQTHRTH